MTFERKREKPTEFMFYWTGFKEKSIRPKPIWIDVTEDGVCSFVVGSQFTNDLELIGSCKLDDLSNPINTEMTFAAQPNKTHYFTQVDTFNSSEIDEPHAVRKWTDGDSLFVWEKRSDEKKDWQKYLREIWRDYDLDDSGSLSKDEAAEVIQHMRETVSASDEWSWYYEDEEKP
jgi:hypothetical protein